MLRGFDQQHLEHDLARLEQVQERLWQRYLQLLPQLDQVTQELQALKRQRALKQRRAELKRLRKQLLNELPCCHGCTSRDHKTPRRNRALS